MSSSHNGKKPDECKTCGSHDSACKCQSKALERKMKPLTNDCIVVDSVICSKEVQKVAEARSRRFGTDTGAENINIEVTVHEERISQNIIVIKDKIINIGVVPVTVMLRGPGFGPFDDFDANIVFQEETDCPGVCPGDTVTESPLQVEAVIAQLIQERIVFGPIFSFIVKIILRTTITATRRVIKSKDGCLIDVNENRCEVQLPSTIQPPTLFGGPSEVSPLFPFFADGNETFKNLAPQENDTN